VYNSAVKDVVEDVMKGFNGTVMAYGQTGAGKTYTLGNVDPTAIGMIPRAVMEIFRAAQQDSFNIYTVTMSYIQIYMELIHDLLHPTDENLQIREDANNGVYLAGVHEEQVRSLEECLHWLEVGEKNRVFAYTHLNAHSSRSHAVVMLTVVKSRKYLTNAEKAEVRRAEKEGVLTQKVKVGKLYLVDLAGSERLKKSGSIGIRADEARCINLSLTTLGMCINARATESTHVPFRSSKLTRLLQESLGGNAKTTLVVCVADAREYADETLQSLQFGSRAMSVKNKPVVNERIDYRVLHSELLSQMDLAGERASELEVVLTQTEEERDKLMSDLEKEREKHMAIMEALQSEMRQEVHQAKQELRARDTKLDEYQHQLQQYQQKISELEAEKAGMIEAHYVEVAALNNQLQEKEEEQRITEAAIQKGHQRELAALTVEIGSLKNLLESHKAQEQTLREVATGLQQQLTQAHAEQEAARRALDRLKQEIEAVMRAKPSLSSHPLSPLPQTPYGTGLTTPHATGAGSHGVVESAGIRPDHPGVSPVAFGTPIVATPDEHVSWYGAEGQAGPSLHAGHPPPATSRVSMAEAVAAAIAARQDASATSAPVQLGATGSTGARGLVNDGRHSHGGSVVSLGGGMASLGGAALHQQASSHADGPTLGPVLESFPSVDSSASNPASSLTTPAVSLYASPRPSMTLSPRADPTSTTPGPAAQNSPDLKQGSGASSPASDGVRSEDEQGTPAPLTAPDSGQEAAGGTSAVKGMWQRVNPAFDLSAGNTAPAAHGDGQEAASPEAFLSPSPPRSALSSASLHTQVDALATMTKDVQRAMHGMVAANNKQASLLIDRHAEVSTLTMTVAGLQADIVNLEQRLSQRDAQLAQTQSDLFDNQSLLASKQDELKTTQAQLQSTQAELSSHQEQLSKSLADIKQLQQELEAQGEELEGRHDMVQQLMQQLSDVERALDREKQARSQVERTFSSAQETRAELLLKRTALRRQEYAALTIQRAYRRWKEAILAARLRAESEALEAVKQEQRSTQLASEQAAQRAAQLQSASLGAALVLNSVMSMKEAVESIMTTFVGRKKELEASRSLKLRITSAAPVLSGASTSASTPAPARAHSVTSTTSGVGPMSGPLKSMSLRLASAATSAPLPVPSQQLPSTPMSRASGAPFTPGPSGGAARPGRAAAGAPSPGPSSVASTPARYTPVNVRPYAAAPAAATAVVQATPASARSAQRTVQQVQTSVSKGTSSAGTRQYEGVSAP